MYNNFSSKKTKKVISALLASALVVTSGPITADAATAKVVGIKKTFTVSASATNKVTGLSKAEKKVVKVTKKGKKFTIKGLKAGKATFKIGKKSYTVKVGATTVKAAKTKLTLTKGKAATLKFTTKSGNGDTLTFKASNKNVTLAKKSAKIAKSAASVKATAKKAGKTTITATSKATGKKATVTVTVKNAAKPATTTPGASNTPVATATGSATNTPEATATATATATASGSATNTPDVTATPVATATGTATATPVVTGSATNTPEATEVPTEAPTKAPEVVTGGTITVTGTAVSGATIVVTNVSGAAVNIKDRLPAGTYTVTVSREGYETQSKEVVIADKDAKVVEINLEKMIEVDKVEALNLAEIKVTFTKALTTTQATEAAKKANYTVRKDAATSDSTIDNISVSDDKKSVTLLLSASTVLEQGKTANKVTVAKAIGMAADYTTTTVKSDDVKVPQIEEVTAVGNKMIKVTFSEAVNLTNDSTGVIAGASTYFNVFANSDTDISVAAATPLMNTASISADKKTVTITLKAAQPVGTYKLVVYGEGTKQVNGNPITAEAIKDFATYPIQDTTKTVDIKAASNVAQASEITVSDRKTVKVKFDGPVSTEETPSLTWTQGATSKTSNGVSLKGTDTLEFTFADSIATGSVDFKVSGVKDAYGYTVVDKTFTGVKVAEAANVAVTVKVVNDDKIEVVFSSKMQNTSSTDSSVAGDAANITNYTLVNAKGEKVDLSGVTATYGEDGTTYKTTLSKNGWDLTAGTYTLTVAGVKNTYGDTMTSYTDANVVVTDTTKPYVSTAAVSAGSSTKSNKIAITFNEAMATTGDNAVTNVKAYTINYAGTVNAADYVALPSTATVTASADGKTVFIEIPYSTTTAVTAASKLKVGIVGDSSVTTVADASGNILDGSKTATTNLTDVGYGNTQTDTTATINLAADGAPTLSTVSNSVYVKDATSLYVKTDGTFASVDASDFEYTLDGANYTAAKSVSLYTGKVAGQTTDAQYVVVELSDTMSAKTDRSKVNVRIPAKTTYKSKTALGTPVNASVVMNDNSGSGAIAADPEAWTLKAGIKSAEVLGDKTVRVEFTGNVDITGTLGSNDEAIDYLANFLEVVNGTTVATGDSDFTAIVKDGDNAVILTLAAAKALDTQKTTTVRTKAYSTINGTGTWAKDANGVYYTENVTGVTAEANQTKLKVVDVKLTDTNGTLVSTDSDKIVVTFNTAVDAASLGLSGSTPLVLNGTTKAKLGTDGVLTIPNVGTISGFEKPSATVELDSLTLQLTAENALTVTFSNTNAIKGAGTLKFTPNTGIKNAQKTETITVETKDAGSLNVAPSVKSTTLAGTLASGKEAKIVFSEALSVLGKEAVKAGITTSDANASLTFTWSSDDSTVTIKNTGTASATITVASNVYVTDKLGYTSTNDLARTLNDTEEPTTPTAALSADKKTVTLTFTGETGIANALTDAVALKAAIEIATNGSDFAALNSADTVAISGNTIVITFNTALSTATNKIQIGSGAIKDAAGNASTSDITTSAIDATA
jgi:hypothetical protein